MAVSTCLKIKGHVIRFTFGDGDLDGVTIHPSNARLSDPSYLEALEIALGAYPDGLDFFRFKEYYDVYGTDRDEDEVRQCLETCKRLMKSSRWPLDDDDYSFLFGMANSFEQSLERIEKRKQRKEDKVRRAAIQQTKRPGYVYLVQSPTSAYKIGRTKNPNKRIKTLGVTLPFEVELSALIKTDDMYGLEASLHLMFDGQRVNGEWFALSPDDVAYIKSLEVRDE